MLQALLLSMHAKGNHRIKIHVFKGTLTFAIKKKLIVKVARLKNAAWVPHCYFICFKNNIMTR